ncbi:MAG: hypothetical protein ACI4CS_11840 [Candidatus Weimeria sp.]
MLKTKIILIALGIAILAQGKNFILERLKSQEEWQKQKLHKGAETVKKFAEKGVIGEDKDSDDVPDTPKDTTETEA